MKLKVKVTNEHIKKGKKDEHQSCPVALAMKDAGCKNPSVSHSLIYTNFNERDTEEGLPPPKEVSDFVNKFDADYPVEPFQFELEV